MVKKLITRNGNQCRTHHQKMLITHKTPYKIINYLEGKILQKQPLLSEEINDIKFFSQLTVQELDLIPVKE